MSAVSLRPYLAADARRCAEIFRSSINELAADDYDEGQREAWASRADDELTVIVIAARHVCRQMSRLTSGRPGFGLSQSRYAKQIHNRCERRSSNSCSRDSIRLLDRRKGPDLVCRKLARHGGLTPSSAIAPRWVSSARLPARPTQGMSAGRPRSETESTWTLSPLQGICQPGQESSGEGMKTWVARSIQTRWSRTSLTP